MHVIISSPNYVDTTEMFLASKVQLTEAQQYQNIEIKGCHLWRLHSSRAVGL
jgi:hypothetical protein